MLDDRRESHSINDEEYASPIKKRSCRVPQRFLLSATCFVGLAVNYMMRVNVSSTIVPMAEKYGWDSTFQGLLLSSFYVGYMINQVPGGLLSKKYGAKVKLNLHFPYIPVRIRWCYVSSIYFYAPCAFSFF